MLISKHNAAASVAIVDGWYGIAILPAVAAIIADGGLDYAGGSRGRGRAAAGRAAGSSHGRPARTSVFGITARGPSAVDDTE